MRGLLVSRGGAEEQRGCADDSAVFSAAFFTRLGVSFYGGVMVKADGGMVHVIAELSFVLESREAFLDAFRRLEPLVRIEDGCIEYRGAEEVRTAIAAQSSPRGGVLMVIEKWASEAALEAHLGAPHMGVFAEETRGMLTGREIRIARDI